MVQWGEFRVKNGTFAYINFFGVVLFFSSKNIYFAIFISCFSEASDFRDGETVYRIGIHCRSFCGDNLISRDLMKLPLVESLLSKTLHSKT